MPGEREIVQAGRGHVDAPVRHQLSAVHRDPGTVPVRDLRELRQRQALAGDVGRACHRQYRGRPACEFCPDRGDRLAERGPGRDDAALPRLPGQQVGMVLDVQVHDRSVNGRGEQVERVGGIAGDDEDVAVTGADERRDLAAGNLVSTGTHHGGISRATVHAGVQRQQLRGPVGHRAQRGRAGRIVKVHVAGSSARDNGDLQGGSNELGQRQVAGH